MQRISEIEPFVERFNRRQDRVAIFKRDVLNARQRAVFHAAWRISILPRC